MASQVPKDVLEAERLKNPRVRVVEHMEEQILIRPARRSEWKKYRTMAVDPDPNVKSLALESLLVTTTVWPDSAGLSALLDDYPGFAEVMGKQAAILSGGFTDAEVKKA
jgi:hypothetical protein